jgi:alkylated DNA repair dioxygenase AlkB
VLSLYDHFNHKQVSKDLFSDLLNGSKHFEKQLLEDGEYWFMRDFLLLDQALKYESILLNTIEWKQEEVFVFGKKHKEPRKTAWYGDEKCVYSYAGKTNHPLPWNEALFQLKTNIEALIPGANFNSVLLNQYRDGNDKMGWHSDNEKELGKNPIIASLSLGATRFFDLKHKRIKSLKKRLELPAGSLLIMCGSTQENWLHQVPQQKTIKDRRINLTFREVKVASK